LAELQKSPELLKNKCLPKSFIMKNKLLLWIFLCSAWTLQAQYPPNGSFEEWEADGQYERPLGWFTNNLDNFESVSKSDDAFSGEYAVQLTANYPTFEGPYPGVLEITVPVDPDYPPEALHFTAKFVVTADTGQASVQLTLFGPGGSDFQLLWLVNEDMEEYTSFEIPINYSIISAPDSIQIRFFGGSVVTGLGQLGNGVLLVDNVRLGIINVLPEYAVASNWSVFPNPTTDCLHFDWKGFTAVEQVELIDFLGRIWWESGSGVLPSFVDVGQWPAGSYAIRVRTKYGIEVQYFQKY
jgi:hypothetical protein